LGQSSHYSGTFTRLSAPYITCSEKITTTAPFNFAPEIDRATKKTVYGYHECVRLEWCQAVVAEPIRHEILFLLLEAKKLQRESGFFVFYDQLY
jgi:hypothetical protein